MGKINCLWAAVAVLSFTAMAADFNLTGDWETQGASCYFRQIGDVVYWYCESSPQNPDWTSVGFGNIVGNKAMLNWTDVPKGNKSLVGSVVLNITSNDQLQVMNESGEWNETVMLTRTSSGF
jgi:hypothetical protein